MDDMMACGLRRYMVMDRGHRCLYYRAVAGSEREVEDMAREKGYDLMGLVVVEDGMAGPREHPSIMDAVVY
ncbi:MAG: hypothetical protein EOM65_04915 [Synergistales bacterium]|nr:hypothetical protein [Synergistales bacterium]